MRRDLILFLIIAACLAALYFALPPLCLYANDGGAKYIQMKSFYLHHWQKLHIDYPGQTIGLDFSYLNPTRFFIVKHGLLYCSYEPLFALLSSFLFPLLGDRVIHFFPLMAFAGSLVLMAKILGIVTEKKAVYYALLLAFLAGSPVLLYSVTFWEHLPAVFLAVAGLYCLTVYFKIKASRSSLFAGSLLLTFGIFFRTETWFLMIGFAAALLWALVKRKEEDRIDSLLGGIFIPIAGYLAFNFLIYRNPLGLHATIHLPYQFSALRTGTFAGILAAAYLALWMSSKLQTKELFGNLCTLAAISWVAAILLFFRESPIPNLLILFPLFFVVFLETPRIVEHFLKAKPDLEGVVFTALITFVSLMAIFFNHNPDLSERYMLEVVPLVLVLLGLKSKEISGNKPVAAIVCILVAVSIFSNLSEFKNRILHWKTYNSERVAFLKNHTADGDVVIFEANPLMEHCGPLYFDRIFVVTGPRHKLSDVLETLKTKGRRDCYLWTMNSGGAKKYLTDLGYEPEEYRFSFPKGPSQYLMKLDLKTPAVPSRANATA